MDTNVKQEEKEVIKPYDDAKINEHAAKCGGKRNLRELIISTDDNFEFHYLIKKPSRATMQAVASSEQKKDIDSTQRLMLGCVLEGDKEAYEHDGSIYVNLLKGIGELAHIANQELKKI